MSGWINCVRKTVQQNINKNKLKDMKKRNYVYDYEITRKRKFLNGLEQVVNYGTAITFGVVVFGGVIIALLNMI